MVTCKGNQAEGDDEEQKLDNPSSSYDFDNLSSPEDLFEDCSEINMLEIFVNNVEISIK